MIFTRLQYWLRDSLDPRDFHILNIVLHSIVCVFTYFVFQILLEWSAPEVCFYASVLFAVHPIHTESVSISF